MTVRLVHLTDPHLATPPAWRTLTGRSHHGKRFLGYLSWARKRRHELRPEWLVELCAAAAATAPDQWLLTGDLAQIGTEEEIRAAGAWLRALAPAEAVTFVPGNHDVYAAESLPCIRREWGPYLPEGDYPLVRRLADVAVFGLSSAVPTAPLSATGRLGTDQLHRLEAALSRHRDVFRVLVLHHPPLPGMIAYRKRLRDAAALAALLERQPVHLILHGHRHRNQRSEKQGTRIYCTAPASAEAGSFRTFQIEREGGGWSVDAALTVRRGPHFEAAESESWSVSGPG
ncbi:MAG: metallophosphoesterase [Pseudomonadales bacterium]